MTGLPPWSRAANIGDYDGALDKSASDTEGSSPYAWAVYRDVQAMLGSAYTQSTNTLVHAGTLSLARLMGHIWLKYPEKIRANALPGTSDERLTYWATVQGIPFGPSTPRYQVRVSCEEKYKLTDGATAPVIDQTVTNLLGPALVKIWRLSGELDNPPQPTYTPQNPLAAADLGGGSWSSARARILVSTTQPPGMLLGDYLTLTRTTLASFFDRVLPATMDFVIAGDGFYCDISRTDLDGMFA